MTTPEESVTFERAAGYYDQTRGFPTGIDQRAADTIASIGGVARESVLVEIGVGTGRIALPLAQRSGPYYGVDLSSGMMAALAAKRNAYPGGDIRLAQADVMRLPLRSASADFAVLVHILHLVPDPSRAVRELERVLKPGGAALAGWNRSDEPTLRPLEAAWEAVTGDSRGTAHADHGPLWLEAGGWTLRAETVLRYQTTTTAEATAATYRRRVYSRMWRVSDEAWRAGVEAVEAALTEHFSDPHAPQPVDHRFHVALYAP